MGFAIFFFVMAAVSLGLFLFTLKSAREFWDIEFMRSDWAFLCCLTLFLFGITTWSAIACYNSAIGS